MLHVRLLAHLLQHAWKLEAQAVLLKEVLPQLIDFIFVLVWYLGPCWPLSLYCRKRCFNGLHIFISFCLGSHNTKKQCKHRSRPGVKDKRGAERKDHHAPLCMLVSEKG